MATFLQNFFRIEFNCWKSQPLPRSVWNVLRLLGPLTQNATVVAPKFIFFILRSSFIYERKIISSTFLNMKYANWNINQKSTLKISIRHSCPKSPLNSSNVVVFLKIYFLLARTWIFARKNKKVLSLMQFCTFYTHFSLHLMLFNVSPLIWKAENVPKSAGRLVSTIILTLKTVYK